MAVEKRNSIHHLISPYKIKLLTIKATNTLYLEKGSLLHFEAVTVINSTGYALFGLNLQREASFTFCWFISKTECVQQVKKICASMETLLFILYKLNQQFLIKGWNGWL